MKPRSLRVRLALWHAGLLGLTLVVLSALTLVLMRSVLSSRLDQSLLDFGDKTATEIADTLYQARAHGRGEPPNLLVSSIQADLGRFVQVVDARTGDVREKSAGLQPFRLTTSLDARVNGQKGRPTFETRYDLGEYPVRVVTVPVQMGRSVPYLVQAVGSLGGIQEALQRTALILLVLTPSIFVLSLLGGWTLVGRSLQPVDAMTRTALAMEPGRLAHRIDAPGSDDEIARLASAFNEMMGRLDRSFRQIQQFSADASHELRTPLTAIRGQAEVALMGDLSPEEYRAVLGSIVDDVARMSAIVENLLLLARADAEQIEVRRERLSLDQVTLEVYEQLEPLARRKGVALDIAEVAEAEVLADPLWIGQIATNLLNNAIKYTPEGGHVTVAVRVESRAPDVGAGLAPPDRTAANGQSAIRNPQSAILSVSDTGPGIPPEHLPRIFDRFYRVDTGRSRDAGGVGLGLNIAKWAAEAQGGRIEVESEVGRGTTFALVLPLAPPVEANSAADAPAAAPAASTRRR